MKLLRIFIIGTLAVSAAFSSCKKDKETETIYLSGSLTFDHKFEKYSAAGETHVFTVSEVSRREEDKSTDCVGYLFYTSLNSKKDTVRQEGGDPGKKIEWSCKIPSDHLGSFTVYCQAFAKGYSSKSASTSTTVVNPSTDGKGSIVGFGFGDSETMVTDKCGKQYPYTVINGTSWMMQNLSETSCGTAYDSADILSDIFGRFYTWDEAMAACPDGWTLPSSSDWDELMGTYSIGSLMADVSFNGNKMWEYWPKVKIDNASRLAIMPSGYAMISKSGTGFAGMDDYAMFWTSDESDSDFAIARYIYEDNPNLLAGLYDKKGIGASVRCIRK